MTQRPGAGFDEVSTIQRPSFLPTPPSDASVGVEVVAGPDTGRTLTLDGAEASPVLVGQSPVCDLRLTDREVSRRHLSLELVGREVHLRDLGSTNGTFVNGVRVVEAFLVGGELVRLGSTALRIGAPADRGRVTLPKATGFGRIVGASTEMRRLYPLCARLAASNVPVIIEGETGTGKEVLAESLHEMGPRASAPFVVFDCTAVAANLLESELFGHERGAFTGASATRKGVFEQAHGGTLFIDEIGDLDLLLQPKLLRALERSEIRRVGGDRFMKVDVRVIAATRRDLDREVQEGRFRDDLFHRLAVARVELPPLRKRRGDVLVLASHFTEQLESDPRTLPAALVKQWERYGWPGNVRELRNAVARHLALGELAQRRSAGLADASEAAGDQRGQGLAEGHPGSEIERILAAELPFVQARQELVEEFERRFVQRVLEKNGGNVAQAAAASGLGRRYFQRLKARQRG